MAGDRPSEGPTPLLAWATAAWIGALLGWGLDPPRSTRTVVAALGALVLLAAVAGVAVRVHRGAGRPGRRAGWTLLGLVLVAVVAGLTAQQRAAALDAGPLAAVATRGGPITIEATVASEPMPQVDGTSWVLVTVTTAGDRHGRWRAMVGGLADPPAVGARLGATATARPLEHDGFEGSLRRRHAGVQLDAER